MVRRTESAKQLVLDFDKERDTFPITKGFSATLAALPKKPMELWVMRWTNACWDHFIKHGGNVEEALSELSKRIELVRERGE